ncbi:MAG: hypothetical protein C4287_00970 [Leptolyngbya sp. ERB_1_2]
MIANLPESDLNALRSQTDLRSYFTEGWRRSIALIMKLKLIFVRDDRTIALKFPNQIKKF